jgi:hypothetical protein
MSSKPDPDVIPRDAEAAVRFWRDRVTKLEAEVAELKAALARNAAIEEGRKGGRGRRSGGQR